MAEIVTIDTLKNSCGLVAMRELTHRPDREIIHAFVMHGYKYNDGVTLTQMRKAGAQLGLIIDTDIVCAPHRRRPTLGAVARTCGNIGGTFIVYTEDHVFLIVDGAVCDPGWGGRVGMRRRVSGCLPVRNPVPVPIDGPIVMGSTRNKRKGTRAWHRLMYARHWWLRNKGATAAQLVAATPYTWADVRWDLARGLMRYARPWEIDAWASAARTPGSHGLPPAPAGAPAPQPSPSVLGRRPSARGRSGAGGL